jgi:hypothetical protein
VCVCVCVCVCCDRPGETPAFTSWQWLTSGGGSLSFSLTHTLKIQSVCCVFLSAWLCLFFCFVAAAYNGVLEHTREIGNVTHTHTHARMHEHEAQVYEVGTVQANREGPDVQHHLNEGGQGPGTPLHPPASLLQLPSYLLFRPTLTVIIINWFFVALKLLNLSFKWKINSQTSQLRKILNTILTRLFFHHIIWKTILYNNCY